MINLHKLDIFTKVVQAGSFSRAAESLLMSQSAVSQHVRDLETSLGTSLFKRGPRGVTLTESGETLHAYVQEIFRLLAEAEAAVTNVKNLNEGRITIGATPGVAVYLLPEWVREFRVHYPNLMVALLTGTSSQILDDLRTGRSDIGIVEGEVDATEETWLGVQPLEEVEQLVVVGPKHPWWGRDELSIAELKEQRFIMRQPNSHTRIWLDDMLRQYNIQPQIDAEFDNIESIKRAVSLGTCIAILPPYATQQEQKLETLHLLPVQDAELHRTLKLVWNAENPFSPLVVAFLQHLATAHLPHVAEFVAARFGKRSHVDV